MQYRNPHYNKHGTIDCEVNHPKFGWVPFTASPNDCEEHGRLIFQNIISNEKDIPAYVPPPPPSGQELMDIIRDYRNTLLIQSDWTQVGDLPDSVKQPWLDYRLKLRDIPQQSGFPDNVVWPIPPDNPDWKDPVWT